MLKNAAMLLPERHRVMHWRGLGRRLRRERAHGVSVGGAGGPTAVATAGELERAAKEGSKAGAHVFGSFDHAEKDEPVPYQHCQHDAQIRPLAASCFDLVQLLHDVLPADGRPRRHAVQDEVLETQP